MKTTHKQTGHKRHSDFFSSEELLNNLAQLSPSPPKDTLFVSPLKIKHLQKKAAEEEQKNVAPGSNNC